MKASESRSDNMQCLLADVALVLHPNDNVAIAKHALDAGTIIAMPNNWTMTFREAIPAGHKFALRAISLDHPVLRYGYSIGSATQPVQPGDWVHTHNLAV